MTVADFKPDASHTAMPTLRPLADIIASWVAIDAGAATAPFWFEGFLGVEYFLEVPSAFGAGTEGLT